MSQTIDVKRYEELARQKQGGAPKVSSTTQEEGP